VSGFQIIFGKEGNGMLWAENFGAIAKLRVSTVGEVY
jgi:hypothetical protein